MSSFELEQSKLNLDKAKREFMSYLERTYKDSEQALNMYQYFENVIEKICKRVPFEIKITGGSPGWHAAVLARAAVWIELEDEVGELMFEELQKLRDSDPHTVDETEFDF